MNGVSELLSSNIKRTLFLRSPPVTVATGYRNVVVPNPVEEELREPGPPVSSRSQGRSVFQVTLFPPSLVEQWNKGGK